MGYIIPFTHHTYHNYQHRMQESKEGPHYIDGSYKAVFHKVREEHDENNGKRESYQAYENKQEEKEAVRKNRSKITEYERALLVGKGENFHETV